LIVIEYDEVDPVHETPALVKVGIMEMVPLIGALVELVPTKTGTVFEPDVVKPMA
jgi:hypothetical protein